jgi:hypothetical protein
MPLRKRPRSRHAGRPRARKTTANKRLAHQRRVGKRRPIPLARLSERSQAARDRALHALASSRNDPSIPLTVIVKREGTKVETIRKYFPSALKRVNGKLQVTKSDRYKKTLYLPDAEGNPIPVKTRSSKERSDAGKYLRDLGRALRGNRKALSKWRRKKRIAGVELVTDEHVIVAIEPALSDFHLYRQFNVGGA